MLLKRQLEMETTNLMVGDVVWFTLKDGEEVEAMAMKKEEDGMVFAFIDCLAEERPMIDKNGVTLTEWMNDELLKKLPVDLMKRLVVFEDGTYLRLMTQKEVFGGNSWDAEEEPDTVEQFEPMKIRRNRIADLSKGSDEWTWWWLSNKTWLRAVATSTNFAYVNSLGNSDYSGASTSIGVRPAFKISDL